MEKVYLNFKKHSGRHIGRGHNSSNGWVTSWTDYVTYKLTIDRIDYHLPLAICNLINEHLLRYPNYENSDQDWGICLSEYHNEENVDINELIQHLNDSQNIFEFHELETSQPYDIKGVLSESLKNYQESLNIIRATKQELNIKILKLKSDYMIVTAERLYPHLKSLIKHNQVDFFSTYAGLEYYPLDIIAINKDFELLISCILNYNPPFSLVNEIYTILCTGQYSYFEITKGTINELTDTQNQTLSSFIKTIERNYGFGRHNKDGYSKPVLLKGMTNLVLHFLLNKEYENYNKLMENYIYHWMEDGFYGFKSILRFAYISDSRWDKISLISSCNEWGSDSRFVRESLFSPVGHNPNWVPFLKRILDNDDAIEKLFQFFNGYYPKYTKEDVCGRIMSIINEYE